MCVFWVSLNCSHILPFQITAAKTYMPSTGIQKWFLESSKVLFLAHMTVFFSAVFVFRSKPGSSGPPSKKNIIWRPEHCGKADLTFSSSPRAVLLSSCLTQCCYPLWRHTKNKNYTSTGTVLENLSWSLIVQALLSSSQERHCCRPFPSCILLLSLFSSPLQRLVEA